MRLRVLVSLHHRALIPCPQPPVLLVLTCPSALPFQLCANCNARTARLVTSRPAASPELVELAHLFFYHQAIQTWHTDKHPDLPIGPPELLMSTIRE